MTTPELIRTETEEQAVEPAHSQAPATTRQRAIVLIVAALVIVADHFSKLLVEMHLPLNHTWAPFPELAHLFQFTHVSNTGAAFGLFPGGSLFFTLIAIVVALIIVIYNYGLPGGHILLRVALGLQVGGALGNLADRLRLGHVTDFLDFGPWPIFNLADTSIVAGVVVLGFLMLWEERQSAVSAAAAEETVEEALNEADGVSQSSASQSSLSRLSTQQRNEQAT